MPDAITPTRIIPPGGPLPGGIAPPPPPPPRPPAPPVRATPDPEPPPAAAQVVVREIIVTVPPAAPEPPLWSRITGRLHLARTAVGAGLALTPLIHGHSATAWWATQLIGCRHYEPSDPATAVGAAWILALIGIGVTTCIDLAGARKRLPLRILTRAGLCAAVFGTVAMASPYDIVTALTGVTQ